MKILSISSDRNIFEEGSGVRTRQIEYGSLFDELHIIVFTKHLSKLPRQVQIAPNVWVFGTNSASKFLYVRDAVKIAQKIIAERNYTSADTVVSTQDPFEAGLVGVALKKKFGLPFHAQIHIDFLNPYFAKESFLNRIRVSIGKKVLPKADAIRPVSNMIAESLSEIALASDMPRAVLPVFVDTQKITETPTTSNLKKKYPQFDQRILMASRLVPQKNISFALNVFKKVLERHPKTGLIIVGSGPEKEMLTEKVARLGIESSVVFEPWQHDLVSYYKTADIFLLTSNNEGYGMTLVEAVAAGCPTISSDVGIARDLLTVCPVGDAQCFVDRISAILESPETAQKAARESFARLGRVAILKKEDYLRKYKENVESARRLENR